MGRRKGTRYLSLLRGNDAPAKARLLQYFNGEIKPKYPDRAGNRPPQELVFLDPFGIPLGAGAKLGQKVTSGAAYNAAKAWVQGFIEAAAPASAEDKITLPGLLTCRAAITTGRNDIGTDTVSKITGNTYKKYGGDTVSVPFGEGATADLQNEDVVFRVILSRVKAANAKNQCSFVPGSYSQT
jgi:NAD(P)-dependent dehydrogenase (short-subunit alcohol dehydrogenase family)